MSPGLPKCDEDNVNNKRNQNRHHKQPEPLHVLLGNGGPRPGAHVVKVLENNGALWIVESVPWSIGERLIAPHPGLVWSSAMSKQDSWIHARSEEQ